jgi:hypothetical protein
MSLHVIKASRDHRRRLGAIIPKAYVLYNATNTKATVTDNATIQDLHDGAMTAELWIRMDGAHEGDLGFMLRKGDAGAIGWLFTYNTDLKRLFATILCATANAVKRANADLIDSTWHHLAFTWDDATYLYPRLWIDGTEPATQGTTTRNGAIVSDVGDVLTFGAWWSGLYTINGAICFIRLSNIVRYTATFTPPDRRTPPAPDGDTVEQWNFAEGSGATLTAQVSSPANDAALLNHTWGID